MSTAYSNFAYVYDTFMDNIPYNEWSSYLVELFSKFGVTDGTLAELGCGTGTMALLMKEHGFQVIGIDNSDDMLTIAADKIGYTTDITLLKQDMCELDLGMKIAGIYCVCDSLNYLLTEDEILQTFRKVKAHLLSDGVFIFDLKTPFFYQEILGDQTFCDHQENCSYTWENSFFEEDNINQYDLTIFVREENNQLFQRFQETHHQKAYSYQEIIDLLELAGLECLKVYDAFTENPPQSDSERIYIIAQNKK